MANSIGRVIGTGNGRGIGLLIILAGILLAIMAIILSQIKAVQILEKRGEQCV